MSKIITAFKLFSSKRRLFVARLYEQFSFLFSDKHYLDRIFKYRVGYSLNWNNPQTFNEKLNWLKIHDRNPLYTKLVDKDAVKTFVTERIGSEYVIPTIAKWNTPEEVEVSNLPDRFVLKTTHGGGNDGVYICKDKGSFDRKSFVRTFSRAMKQDIYKTLREWPYKNVKKQIICEPYIEDSVTGELRDYKFFCFDGKVRALFVATERQKKEEPFITFFDHDYNQLPIRQGHPISNTILSKPHCFEEMKNVASLLSKGFPHVRVDLYEVDNKVLFGEMTFYNFSGLVPFEPSEWDLIFGKWLDLPRG